MYLGFCVRVLVLSLLTFGEHANALGYRSEGSSGIKPLFDYPRNHNLALASDFERSAQSRGFLGSSGSSHSEGGQVDRYSPERSVSSYRSGSLNIRKPTNSRQPLKTNANGVIQNKVGMWASVLPQNGKRFELGISSSRGIDMQAGPRPPPEPKPSVYKPQQPGHQPSVYHTKPQQPGHQPSVYHTKPQQPGYQPSVYHTKPQQPGYRPSVNKPQQPGYRRSAHQNKPQQPGYQPSPHQPKLRQPKHPGYQPSAHQTKPKHPGYKPQQVGLQSKPAMWELFSPVSGVSGPNVQPVNLNAPMTVPPKTRPILISSPHHPRWPQSLVPV